MYIHCAFITAREKGSPTAKSVYKSKQNVSEGWLCGELHVMTVGTANVTILRVSVCWWFSGVHIRLLVLLMLPYTAALHPILIDYTHGRLL